MTQAPGLTTRQAKILAFIRNRVCASGRPPTLREIGAQFGFASTGTTRGHLSSLAKKGFLTYGGGQARSIELKPNIAFRIPILGHIAAGMPDIAEEEPAGYLELDTLLPRPDQNTFALRVRGESMIEKGIFNNDIAVIQKQKVAAEGDIVAALIDSEATIKMLKKNGRSFYLAPANKNFPEIHKTFTIIGKVIAVLKRY